MITPLAALASVSLLGTPGQDSPTLIADLVTAPLESPPPAQPFSIRGAALGLLWMDGVRANVPSRVWTLDGSGAEPQSLSAPGLELDSVATGELLGMADLGTGLAVIAVERIGSLSPEPLLFGTDGTSAGTVNLGITPRPVFTLPGDAAPYPVVEDGVAYLRALDENGVNGLYRTDGTLGGTQRLADLEFGAFDRLWKVGDRLIGAVSQLSGPGFGTQVFSVPVGGGAPQSLVASAQVAKIDARVVGGRLLFGFRGDPSSAAQFGTELWTTDGTVANTNLLLDIVPGPASSIPMLMGSDGDRAFFSAFTPATGRELWTTDGTAAGTVFAAELAPGATSGVPATVESSAMLGSDIVLRGSDDGVAFEPWFSDGTAAGTRQIADLSSSADGSLPFDFFGTPFFSLGDSVGFGAIVDGIGREPCVTDGVTVTVLGDLVAGPGASNPKDFVPFDDRVFFGAFPDVGGANPWSAAAQPLDLAQEVPLYKPQLNQSSRPRDWVTAAGRGFFTAGVLFDPLAPLYVTDGTPAGTVAIEDPIDSARAVGVLDERLVYFARTPELGLEAYITDGTPSGGSLLADFWPGGVNGVDAQDGGAQLGRHFYFPARTATSGFELARTDGTPAGTEIYAELTPGAADGIGVPFDLLVFGGRLFFEGPSSLSGSGSLWVTDGGPAGALPVAPQFLGDKFLAGFAPLRDDLAVGVHFGGTYEVFTVSAESGGADLRYTGVGALTELATVPNRVVYTFTEGGTSIEGLASVNVQGDYELLLPTGASAFGMDLLAAAPNGVYVNVQAGTGIDAGTYFTDGTAAGTLRIGKRAEQASLAGSGVEVLLGLTDFESGTELWVSDGTLAGTRLVADAAPGFEGSLPKLLGTAGGRFLFAATTPETGEELHAIDLADAGAFLARPFGQGCGLGAFQDLAVSGALRPGEMVAFELSGLAPLRPAGVYLSLNVGGAQLDGCAIYLTSPLGLALAVLDAEGAASVPATVPVDPALVGLELYVQGASAVVGGPLQGAFEVTNGVELVFGP